MRGAGQANPLYIELVLKVAWLFSTEKNFALEKKKYIFFALRCVQYTRQKKKGIEDACSLYL